MDHDRQHQPQKVTIPLKYVTYTGEGDWRKRGLQTQVRRHVAERAHALRLSALDEQHRQTQLDSRAHGDRAIDRPEQQQDHAQLSPRLHLHGAATRRFHNGAASFQLMSLNDPDNVIGLSLSSLGIDANAVIARFQSILAFVGPIIEQKHSLLANTVQPFLFHFVFTNPTLTATVLMATAIDVVHKSGQDTRSPEMLAIRGFVMRSINSHLNTTDQLILAVMFLGAYEAMWGYPDDYLQHSQGMARMIELRGGMDTLGLLHYVIVWQESVNMACLRRFNYDLSILPRFKEGI